MQTNKEISLNKREKNKMSQIFKKSGIIKPKIWIGKDGVNLRHVEQINRRLKTDKLVKIKVQKAISENEEIEKMAKKIIKETNSKLIDIRGRTFTLYKEG
jgi:RNA-binding protein